jgi:hypothetical protein
MNDIAASVRARLLFTLWYDMPHRATRDADLLGFGASDLESVAHVFRDIAAVPVDDGIVFDPASVVVDEIRKEAGYGGVRVMIAGERETLDTDLLAQAIKATFERRGMAVPETLPVGLTDDFAHDSSRQALWLAFLKKNELAHEPLTAIVHRLRAALEPALNRAAESSLK